jgi:hypothetical protein
MTIVHYPSNLPNLLIILSFCVRFVKTVVSQVRKKEGW